MEKLQILTDKLDVLAQDFKNEKHKILIKFLRQRIYNPDAYIVVLGETSCGKSTFLNSMLGKSLLPVSARPFTAAITEIILDDTISSTNYLAITKDAKAVCLNEEQYRTLAIKPKKEINRLRITVPTRDKVMNGVRFYDTPGYGSLVEEHEEILLNFIPNSDAVIYMVNYRSGVQEYDYEFLKQLRNLVREEIPICLVINRVPEDVKIQDRRIKEIEKYVRDILGTRDLPCFVVQNDSVQANSNSISMAKKVFTFVENELDSPKRKKQLHNAFKVYVQNYINLLGGDIKKEIANKKMTSENIRKLSENTRILINMFNAAEKLYIVPAFAKIRNRVEVLIGNTTDKAEKEIVKEIDAQPLRKMHETIGHIKSYLIPHLIWKDTEEIQFYIENEISVLNKKLDEYLNEAVAEFQNSIKVEFQHAGDGAIDYLFKDLLKNLLYDELTEYFLVYSVGGSLKVGVVNAASHALKQMGGLVGKTFSRGTHNALKHFLAKMGLNTAKGLSVAVAVFVEATFIVWDYATWKGTLKKEVKKSLDKWKVDNLKSMRESLDELEKENIKTIKSLAIKFEKGLTFKENTTSDDIKLEDLLSRLCEIEKELKNEK